MRVTSLISLLNVAGYYTNLSIYRTNIACSTLSVVCTSFIKHKSGP